MWDKIAGFILAQRLPLIITLIVLTGVAGYLGRNVENAYDFTTVVPPDDPDMVFFRKFLAEYGEDSNVFAVGMKDSSVYQADKFARFARLSKEITELEGTELAFALPDARELYRADDKTFDARALFNPLPQTQAELDSLLGRAAAVGLYRGQLFNPENGATLMIVTVKSEWLHSKKRLELMPEIFALCDQFSKDTGIKLHYGGIPYIRTVMAVKVKKELNLFLLLSLGMTVVILFVFFRSFSPVFFSLAVIGMVVTWTLGTLGVAGYKITLLTGLLPPILVVIGIPNCIYLLNKYHREYIKCQDKHLAMRTVIQRIGVVTLITNATTAIGFGVLMATKIEILQEFGLVAAVNIFFAFIISIVFIPAVFSYLPAPKARQIKHLDSRFIAFLIRLIERIVTRHRPVVYTLTVLVSLVAAFGMTKIQAVSFMVDDLPEDSPIIADLHFFEKHFKGVMPLEIIVDTGKEKGMSNLKYLKKISILQDSLALHSVLSPAISPASFIKTLTQAYRGGRKEDYEFPSRREFSFMYRYLQKEAKGKKSEIDKYSRNFTDSTGRQIRISLKVADLGSLKLDSLLNRHIRPQIDSAFVGTDFKARITGTTLLFIKGNSYLISSLRSGLGIAILLIALIMGLLFRNFRMVLISLIPNLVPLLAVAGMMGYFGLPLKPSTALIFSIAFGISVDDSIHFLAKYRQELVLQDYNVLKSVQIAIRETGMSMIYTSVVLFSGFIIFVWSEFGGTVALGLLTSATLLIAMCTNLILLPALLITFTPEEKLARRIGRKKQENEVIENS